MIINILDGGYYSNGEWLVIALILLVPLLVNLIIGRIRGMNFYFSPPNFIEYGCWWLAGVAILIISILWLIVLIHLILANYQLVLISVIILIISLLIYGQLQMKSYTPWYLKRKNFLI